MEDEEEEDDKRERMKTDETKGVLSLNLEVVPVELKCRWTPLTLLARHRTELSHSFNVVKRITPGEDRKPGGQQQSDCLPGRCTSFEHCHCLLHRKASGWSELSWLHTRFEHMVSRAAEYT